MAAAGYPGLFPGGLTTGQLSIGAVQKGTGSVKGWPGVFPGGLTTGFISIGAVQRAGPSVSISSVASPFSEGDTGISLTTSNFAGDITSATLRTNDSSFSVPLSITGSGDNYTFSAPSISTISANTSGVPLGSLSIDVTDGTDTATTGVIFTSTTGYTSIAISNPVSEIGTVFETWGTLPADGDLLYYPTADDTTIDAQGYILTDKISGQIKICYFDYSDGNWKPFYFILSSANSAIASNIVSTITSTITSNIV